MSSTPNKHEQTAESLKGLDAILQNRTRLGVCVLLADVEALSFSRLKELLEETDGNLGASLRKLEEAGYVSVKKEFVDRKPVTWYSLSSTGSSKLASHLAALEQVVRQTKLKS